MGDLVLIDQVRGEKEQEQRQKIIAGLEALLDRAKSGEIIGVCFAAIPADRESVTVGALRADECGAHELVGISALLAAYISEAARG
jgi:fructose-bisphosphate aldolase class 1